MLTSATRILAVLALTAAASCSDGPAPLDPKASPIVVGMAVSLTGANAAVGAELRAGTEIAEQVLNGAGGVLGRAVAVRYVDDVSEKAGAGEAVRTLLEQGAVAILGPGASGQVMDTQASVARAAVPQITAWATSPLLSDAQPEAQRFLFRTVPPDDLQGRVVAELLFTGVAAGAGPALGGTCRRAALIASDDAYGAGLRAVLRERIAARPDLTLVAQAEVPQAPKQDYASEVQALLAAAPECLALFLYPRAAAQFLLALRKACAEPGRTCGPLVIAGGDSLYDPTFLTSSQQDATNPRSENVALDVLGTVPNTRPDTGDYSVFRNLYQMRFGREPGAYAANAFDALVLLGLALQAAKDPADGAKVRDALRAVATGGQSYGPAELNDALSALRLGLDVDYRGASGGLDFDAKGNVSGDYIVWRVVRGATGAAELRNLAQVKGDSLARLR